MKTVYKFNEFDSNMLGLAGGKGANLIKLIQQGFLVPDGFIIIPAGFSAEGLLDESWEMVKTQLENMRRHDKNISFAVRSSAINEDSIDASFAGEFESVIDVSTNEEIRKAIKFVHNSRKSDRVKSYSKSNNLDDNHEMAVVIQKLIKADIAGVIFTVDPITGNQSKMIGNYVHGLGESLVSGEANAEAFEMMFPKGKYSGPQEFKKFSKHLFKLAHKVQRFFDFPQDIEWALYNGKIYLLQSRPITTLIGHNTVTGEWNDSLTGEYLFAIDGGGIYPEVVTPATWSLVQETFQRYSISGVIPFGNICGRIYVNCSPQYSIMKKLGWSHGKILEYFNTAMTSIPLDIEIPTIHVTMKDILKSIFVRGIERSKIAKKVNKADKAIVGYVPDKCSRLINSIRSTDNKKILVNLWMEEIYPLFSELFLLQGASNKNYIESYMTLKKDLIKGIGEDLTMKLLTTASTGSSNFSSTEIYFGISKVISGELSREEYQKMAGHRTVNENEIAEPRPYEDPDWIDKKIDEFKKNNDISFDQMTDRRKKETDDIWQQVRSKLPDKNKNVEEKLEKVLVNMEKREIIRSEVTRSIGVVRQFFIRAGELLGLDDDIFFLSLVEVVEMLEGKEKSIAYIARRKKTYDSYKELPVYPAVIKGRFNPFQWSKDENRRTDIFAPDYQQEYSNRENGVIRGNAGSFGVAEGIVRKIDKLEDAVKIIPGEILVTSTTNVGWTPVFSNVSAVVTDIGAPLAHAAIIAREIGIPAVVGCGNATARLKTGDKVLVDGGKGIVRIIEN